MKSDRMEKRITPKTDHGQRKIAVTAVLSEKVLAREWLKPEEDRAWDYL